MTTEVKTELKIPPLAEAQRQEAAAAKRMADALKDADREKEQNYAISASTLMRVRDCKDELSGAQRVLSAAAQQERSAALAELASDPAGVRSILAECVGRLEASLALVARYRAKGLAGRGVPGFVMQEIDELVRWARLEIRAGRLTEKDIPATLAICMGLGQ